MRDLHETVLSADPLGPPFDRWAFDLDSPAAAAADQVMVVAGRATTVDGFTIAGAQDIHLARVRKRLKCAVDRGQADRVTP